MADQEIAQLGISIDSSGVDQAKISLDNLADAASKTETSAKGVENSWSQAAGKIAGDTSRIVSELQSLNSKQDQSVQILGRLSGLITEASVSFKEAAAAISSYQQAASTLEQANKGAANASEQLSTNNKEVAETADQAAARIKEMVAASLAAQQSQQSLATTTRELSQASIENARAQTQAMQAGVRQQAAQKNTADSARQAAEAAEQQRQELSKLLGQIDPVVAALGRLDAQEEKLRGFRATGALDAETFSVFKATIDRNRDALGAFDDSLTRTGNTSKQTAQAIRQLPAQFSDIFVSLQAGQSPLQVFLQQGAQIKDSFGGVGAALRETGRFALGLVNPFTLAAGAVLALGAAYQSGSQEAVKFNEAIILTGNAVGTSAGQLQGMASAIDDVVGTQSKAAAVLAQVVQSGAFTVGQIQQVSQAAIALEEVTGKSVESTINEFKKLGDDPVRAVQELNEQYNFLTAATFDQISALQEQGDAAGAAQLAFDLFSDTLTSRSKEIEDNLGFIETAWLEIKRGASEAWDEMLGIGRPETPDERLSALARGESFNLGRLATRGLVLGPIGAAVEGFKQFQAATLSDEERETLIGEQLAQIQARDEQAWQEGLARQLENDAIGAQARIDQLRTAGLSNAEKRKKALTDLARDLSTLRSVSPNDPRLDPANVARLEADIEKRFADRQSRTPRTPAARDDAATRLLLNLREQESALSLQLSTNEKLTAAEKERAKFIQQIADLQNKEVLTAEQKSLLANQDAIKAQLDKNVALEQEIKLRQQAADEAAKLASFEEVLAANNRRAGEQLESATAGAGLGDRSRQRLQETIKIQQDFARQQEALQRQFNRGEISEDLYKQETKLLEDALNTRLGLQKDFYEKDDEARENWLNGVTRSFENYVDNAQDIASQTEDLFGKALGGIEDAFVELATTGKTSFRDLADSILADIARIGVRSLISNAIIGAGFGPKGAQQQGLSFGDLFAGIGSLFGGGRANGGPVSSNQIYEVGERNMPEILQSGGKSYLIPGNEGRVTPVSSSNPSNSIVINGLSLPGVTNARDGKRAAATIAREVNSLVVGSARFA